MKVSLNILREFIDLHESPEQIASVLTGLGLEIEEINFPAKIYNNFVIARIIDCSKIPNSKNLLCRVSDGHQNFEIVCGAPNVAPNQNVVLALPGAILPKNETKIETIEIDGILSQGMICSEDELSIGTDSTGIYVLPENVQIGTPFAKFFGFDDTVFEIGITPNRADCLSHLGIARELSAYYKRELNLPKIEYQVDSSRTVKDFVQVQILDPEKCPRYTAKILTDVFVTHSPIWLKSRLVELGFRPINVIVDITNYVMSELGQPLHAFDLDKITGHTIIVRNATNGEKIETLDSRQRELDSSMLLITDVEKPLAIAGVMGGESSGITNNTRNVLIESAFFHPSSIRKTSKKLGLTTPSSYRFERGVDFEMVAFANERATQLIASITNAKPLAGIIDINSNPWPKRFINFRYERAKKIIGMNLFDEKMTEILESLGFVSKEKTTTSAYFAVPSYRVDVQYEIDLIEEVARFFGYDNIPENTNYIITKSASEPTTSLAPPSLRKQIREYFVSNGFIEFLTPNLYDPKRARLFAENNSIIELANPLGEELSIMRPSAIPSLLEAIQRNQRIGRKDLRVFEVAKEFFQTDAQTRFIKGIAEREILIIALAGNRYPLQWGLPQLDVDFYDIKGIVQNFLAYLGIENYQLRNSSQPAFSPECQEIYTHGAKLGYFGSIADSILKVYDIDNPIFMARLFLDELSPYVANQRKFSRPSPFPIVRRDLAFVVEENINATEIENLIKEVAGESLKDIVIFDVFRSPNIGANRKSIAFALFFCSREKPIASEDVDRTIENIIDTVCKSFSAELRTF